MILEFSHSKIQNYVSSCEEREQLAQFFTKVENSASSELIINVVTLNGSRLLNMKLLQIIGDTVYLTDRHEAMAVIDLGLIKSIELVG